jgi:uncharacterized MAPEG superfamily protein
LINSGAIVVVVGGLTVFSEPLNVAFFHKRILSEKERYELVRTLGIYLSFFLFTLSVVVMGLRIFTGKSTPAINNDPVIISTLNRVITNTIEQSVIFAGLFASLLFTSSFAKVGGERLLTLASLFIVGRILFTIGYLLGWYTNISSFRAFGFCVNLFVNSLMVAFHLGFNLFTHIDTHTASMFKTDL